MKRFLKMLIVKFVTHVARHLKMKLLYAASVKECAAKAAKIKCNYGKEKIMNFVNMCVFQWIQPFAQGALKKRLQGGLWNNLN